MVDDLYAYRLDAEEFLLVVNASRIAADVLWLEQRLAGFARRDGVELKDMSDEFGALAVQGAEVAAFIDSCFQPGARAVTHLGKNEIARFDFLGQPVFVSRTGYTGEDGFEGLAPAPITEALWNKVLDAGRPFGLIPAGLGARDTLRTEACYPCTDMNWMKTPHRSRRASDFSWPWKRVILRAAPSWRNKKPRGRPGNWPPSKWPNAPRRRVPAILCGAPAENRNASVK